MSYKARWTQIWLKFNNARLPRPIHEEMVGMNWDGKVVAHRLHVVDTASSTERPAEIVAALGHIANLGKGLVNARKLKPSAAQIRVLDGLQSDLRTLVTDLQAARTGKKKKLKRSGVLKLEVYRRNAAGGLRAKWLKVGSIDVSAQLTLDSESAALLKKGKLGFHRQELAAACNAVVDQWVPAFQEAINKIEAKVKKLDESERRSILADAQNTLKIYAERLQVLVRAAAKRYWDGVRARQKMLGEFQRHVRLTVATGVVKIAAASVSLALSLGAAAPTIVGLVWEVYSIASTLKNAARDVESTRTSLAGDMKRIQNLYNQRQAAQKTGQSQVKSKVWNEARDLAGWGVSATYDTTTEYLGKLSQVETDANTLYAKVARLGTSLRKGVEVEDAKARTEMRKAMRAYEQAEASMIRLRNALRADIAFGQNARGICEKLKKNELIASWLASHQDLINVLGTLYDATEVIVEVVTVVV